MKRHTGKTLKRVPTIHLSTREHALVNPSKCAIITIYRERKVV